MTLRQSHTILAGLRMVIKEVERIHREIPAADFLD